MQMVFALSPQAKGRVERTAGTLQDRLVAELRLAGATTIEEANVVLKEFLHSTLKLPTVSWSRTCASTLSSASNTLAGWPGITR